MRNEILFVLFGVSARNGIYSTLETRKLTKSPTYVVLLASSSGRL
jgi:hypothetical protein